MTAAAAVRLLIAQCVVRCGFDTRAHCAHAWGLSGPRGMRGSRKLWVCVTTYQLWVGVSCNFRVF